MGLSEKSLYAGLLAIGIVLSWMIIRQFRRIPRRDEVSIGGDVDKLDLSKSLKAMELRRLADLTIEYAQAECAWYGRWEDIYLSLSNGVRLLSVLLLATAIVVPLAHYDNPDQRVSWLTVGYAAAAVAGLLLSADRFFLLTESWGRFSFVATTLSSKITAFRYECHKLLLGTGVEDVPGERALAFIESCQRFLLDVANEVLTETKEWRTSLDEAAKALAERVGKSTEESRHVLKETQLAALKGDVSVKISAPTRPAVPVDILVDGERRGAVLAPTWEMLVEGLDPGRHVVALRVSRGGTTYDVVRKVTVKPAETLNLVYSTAEVWNSGTLGVSLKNGSAAHEAVQVWLETGSEKLTHDFRHPTWEWDFADALAGTGNVGVTGRSPSGRVIEIRDEIQVVAGDKKSWTVTLPE